MNSQSNASGSAADAVTRPRLGELLLERTNLDAASLQRALKLQAESRERIGQILLQLGMISERDLAGGLAAQLKLPVVQAADYPNTALVHASLAPEFLRNVKAVPIASTESSVQVSMADPLDEFTRSALAMALGADVSVAVGTAGDIDSAIQRLYGDGAGQMEQIVDADPGDGDLRSDRAVRPGVLVCRLPAAWMAVSGDAASHRSTRRDGVRAGMGGGRNGRVTLGVRGQ